MLPTVRRLLLPLVVVVMLVGVVPVSALADGGPTIAAAPLVPYGQQQFGNTATGGITGDCNYTYSSNWLLPVVAGDQVTIDVEIQAIETVVSIYPFGTNDFNIGNGNGAMVQEFLNGNARKEVGVTASASGNLPLEFRSYGGPCGDRELTGPYDFTAYVHHVVRLSLPSFPTIRRRATISIPIHNAEGGVISDPSLLVEVQLKAGRSWIGVGSGTVANSVAAVPLNIPLRYVGKTLSLRAVARGASYLDAASSSQRVLVTMKPKAKPRSRRRRHHRARAAGLLDSHPIRATAADVTPWGYEYDPRILAQDCVDDVIGHNTGSWRNGEFGYYTGANSNHPKIHIRGQRSISIEARVNPLISGLVSPEGDQVPCPAPAGETIQTRLMLQDLRVVRQRLKHHAVRLRLRKTWTPASPWVTAIQDSAVGAPPMPADHMDEWENHGIETLTYSLPRPYTCVTPTVRRLLVKEWAPFADMHTQGIGRGIALQISTTVHSGDVTEHMTTIDEYFKSAVIYSEIC